MSLGVLKICMYLNFFIIRAYCEYYSRDGYVYYIYNHMNYNNVTSQTYDMLSHHKYTTYTNCLKKIYPT